MHTKGKKALTTLAVIGALVLNSSVVWSLQGIQEIVAMCNPNLKILLNGEEKKLNDEDGSQMSPILFNNRTYLPLRSLSNLFGLNINYNQNSSTIGLSSQNPINTDIKGVKLPSVSDEMMISNFWINKDQNSQHLLLDTRGIDEFNKKIIQLKETKVYDLKSYPLTISKEKLLAYINELPFPEEDRYMGDTKVEKAYYDAIKKTMNLDGINQENNLSYGFTVRRTDIRTLPTKDPSYSDPNDFEFDYFQETALEAVEPLLILYKTSDSAYYFIQSRNYRGWAVSKDIAIAKTREQWLSYLEEKDFAVVTANKIILPPNPYNSSFSKLELGMGCKIPISASSQAKVVDGMTSAGSLVAKLPLRNDAGLMEIKDTLLSTSNSLSIGFLPYTKANVITQAYKLLGDRYGWGGLFDSRDCSALICDVYKSMGIILPRNTGEQELSAGTTVKFTNETYKKRKEILSRVLPGSILYMKNHEMLYLGTDGDHQYVIQSVYAYGDKNKPKQGGGFEKVVVNAIVVSDLDLAKRNTGNTFLESITSIKTIE